MLIIINVYTGVHKPGFTAGPVAKKVYKTS